MERTYLLWFDERNALPSPDRRTAVRNVRRLYLKDGNMGRPQKASYGYGFLNFENYRLRVRVLCC